MIKKILNVGHYNFDFFENRKLPAFYNGILYHKNNKPVVSHDFESIEVSEEKKVHRMYNIPPYLDLLLKNPSTYSKLTLPEIDQGFLIDISTFKTVEDYTTQQFSGKRRKVIRAAVKRISTCFNINYVFYHGHIDKENYNYLLDIAHQFITRRFNQISKKHYQLPHWDLIKKNAYELILEKKASIFVIYDDDKPINICFNYHFENITCYTLTSFDVDYSKFSIGTVKTFKQLEWQINNGFTIFDLSFGASEYKSKWSNNRYDLNHNIIIKKKSVISNLLAVLLYCYLKLKFYLFRAYYKNPNNKLLSFLKNAIHLSEPAIKETHPKPIEYKLTDIDLFDFEEANIEKIDVETETYAFLRKPFYDFLHTIQEHKTNVSVFKLNNEENTYVFKRGENLKKLIIVK